MTRQRHVLRRKETQGGADRRTHSRTGRDDLSPLPTTKTERTGSDLESPPTSRPHQLCETNAPLRRQLVQPAANDGRGSLGQGGVTGVGGDGKVLVGLAGEGVVGQRKAAEGGWSFSHSAVTWRVPGVKRLRKTLCPREPVTPENTKNFINAREADSVGMTSSRPLK